jgi:hypothetical protein
VLTTYAVNEHDLIPTEGFTVGYFAELTAGGPVGVTDGSGKDVWGSTQWDSTKLSATGRWLTTFSETPGKKASVDAKTSDYEIRFTDNGSLAYKLGKPASSTAYVRVPFEVWDVSENRNYQVNCQVKEVTKDSLFQYGEAIYIVSSPYVDPEVGDMLQGNHPDDFPYIITFWGAADDSPLPETGEKVIITSYSPPLETDVYTIQFDVGEIKDKITDNDLDEIRVVPNPYIVSAEWELRTNVRSIRFMYLPPECSISVYSLAGVKIKEIKHTNGTGDEAWDLTSDYGEDLAFGVYVYVVTAGDAKKIGKFALIK